MLVDQVQLEYASEHLKLQSILKTELTSKRYGLIIISTVVTATGFRRKEGTFTTYQSKSFSTNKELCLEMYTYDEDLLRAAKNHLEIITIILHKILQK